MPIYCMILSRKRNIQLVNIDFQGKCRGCKSDPKLCASCPIRELCTRSKECVKMVIWKNYENLADDVRYIPEYQALYKHRKEAIQRDFADAKEKHVIHIEYRGLSQVTKWVKLIFNAINHKN